MNAFRSSTLPLSALAAALIAALPVPAAAQGTAAPTIQNSPTACPQGAVAQPPGAQPGVVVCKHAINTKGTGNNRMAEPNPAPLLQAPATTSTADLPTRKTGHVTINR